MSNTAQKISAGIRNGALEFFVPTSLLLELVSRAFGMWYRKLAVR